MSLSFSQVLSTLTTRYDSYDQSLKSAAAVEPRAKLKLEIGLLRKLAKISSSPLEKRRDLLSTDCTARGIALYPKLNGLCCLSTISPRGQAGLCFGLSEEEEKEIASGFRPFFFSNSRLSILKVSAGAPPGFFSGPGRPRRPTFIRRAYVRV